MKQLLRPIPHPGGGEQTAAYKILNVHPIINGILDKLAFFRTHAAAVWFNKLAGVTVKDKIEEIENKFSPASFMPVYMLNMYYDAEAINKLDNPTLLTNSAAPYCILFTSNGTAPGLPGGVSFVFGYIYGSDEYGAQMAISYSGLFLKRCKNKKVWTDWISA